LPQRFYVNPNPDSIIEYALRYCALDYESVVSCKLPL